MQRNPLEFFGSMRKIALDMRCRYVSVHGKQVDAILEMLSKNASEKAPKGE